MSHLIQPIMIAGTPRCVDLPGFEGRATQGYFTDFYKTSDGQTEESYGLSCGSQAEYRWTSSNVPPSTAYYSAKIDLYVGGVWIEQQIVDRDSAPVIDFIFDFVGSPCGVIVTFWIRADPGPDIEFTGEFISIT
jgi:hypothetical protein